MANALMTDLYQLTMAAGYWSYDRRDRASFELFVRRLPQTRNYLVAAGLTEALDYLTNLRFGAEEIEYLRALPQFRQVAPGFFHYLANFRFTGEVWAVPEGALVFANEPIVRVTAPLIEAQIVETYLLACINFQTMIATKAARIVRAASEDGQARQVVEFGTRRAHGPVAGMWAARSAYLAGCTGTSNLAAGLRFKIPVFGTAAHAWTLAFESEPEAFEKFYRVFPDSSTLLIDTYNTEQGARNAAHLGQGVKGVRIDSGDLLAESRKVREILNAAGLTATKVVLSGDLNEHSISALVRDKAPVDIFGVGTELATSRDAPALGGVYKLVERTDLNGQRHYMAKFSAEKTTMPGAKQVFRHYDAEGRYVRDTVGLADEERPADSEPLLVEVMRDGQRVANLPDLEAARARCQRDLGRMNDDYLRLSAPTRYAVRNSAALEALLEQVRREILATT